MNIENAKLPIKTPKYSVQERDLQEEWQRAKDVGENPEEAVAVLRKRLEEKIEGANNVVKMKQGETVYEKAMRETREGIADMAKLNEAERKAMMDEFESKKGMQ
jgi:hypothetical protein